MGPGSLPVGGGDGGGRRQATRPVLVLSRVGASGAWVGQAGPASSLKRGPRASVGRGLT